MQKYLQKSVGFAFHILMRSFSLVCLSSMASRCLFCSVRRSWFSLNSRISSSLRTMAVRTRCGNDKAIDIFTKLCVRRSLGNEIGKRKWLFQKLALWLNPFSILFCRCPKISGKKRNPGTASRSSRQGLARISSSN